MAAVAFLRGSGSSGGEQGGAIRRAAGVRETRETAMGLGSRDSESGLVQGSGGCYSARLLSFGFHTAEEEMARLQISAELGEVPKDPELGEGCEDERGPGLRMASQIWLGIAR